jgi:hypothetical protein
MTSDTPPTDQPASFEIRTLRDIFNLPTKEQMKTCLAEISRGMIQARSMSDLMVVAVKTLGGTPPELALEWPEMVKWTDDGKGRVETKFQVADEDEAISFVTTKDPTPCQS